MGFVVVCLKALFLVSRGFWLSWLLWLPCLLSLPWLVWLLALVAFVAFVAFGFGGFRGFCGFWLSWLLWLLALVAFVASVAVAFGFLGFCGFWLWWLSWLLWLLAFLASVASVAFVAFGFRCLWLFATSPSLEECEVRGIAARCKTVLFSSRRFLWWLLAFGGFSLLVAFEDFGFPWLFCLFVASAGFCWLFVSSFTDTDMV